VTRISVVTTANSIQARTTSTGSPAACRFALCKIGHPPGSLAPVEGLLLDWFAAHGRDLPWRRTKDPYAILVSEVMLQQTQVERVIRALPGLARAVAVGCQRSRSHRRRM